MSVPLVGRLAPLSRLGKVRVSHHPDGPHSAILPGSSMVSEPGVQRRGW